MNASSTPTVSVIMPVYNAAAFLSEAIESILYQSFTDFEFIIINDGSTDNSEQIVLAYSDHRIVYVKNQSNLGVTATLNMGVALSRGKYIARMDADDISHVHRLQKQIDFLQTNPDVMAIGSQIIKFGNGKSIITSLPERWEEIRVHLLFQSPVAHPSSCIRAEVFRKHCLAYTQDYTHAEDYKLWADIASVGKLANLSEPLLHYRVHPNQISSVKAAEKERTREKIMNEQLKALGIEANTHERQMQKILASGYGCSLRQQALELSCWAEKVANACKVRWPHDSAITSSVLALYWFNSIKNSGLGLSAWSILRSNALSAHLSLTVKQKFIFTIKNLLRLRRQMA